MFGTQCFLKVDYDLSSLGCNVTLIADMTEFIIEGQFFPCVV
jgi:hypothetical protein